MQASECQQLGTCCICYQFTLRSEWGLGDKRLFVTMPAHISDQAADGEIIQ